LAATSEAAMIVVTVANVLSHISASIRTPYKRIFPGTEDGMSSILLRKPGTDNL
jgi:hypothetical protein